MTAIAVDDIYGVYKTWAEDNEYPRESKALFGRDLRAAFPSLRKQRRREATGRYWTYVGIGWRKDEDRDSEDLFP